MIDINDPKLWKSYNWDEPVKPFIKSEGKQNVARVNRGMNSNPDLIEKRAEGVRRYHASLTEDEAREYQKIRGEGNKKRWASYTDEERQERNAKLKGKTAKAVGTPWGDFDAALYFNEFIQSEVTEVKITFQDKQKRMPHLYYYKEDGPGEPTYEEVRYTPYGTAVSGNDNFSLKKLFNQLLDTGVISTDDYTNSKHWWRRMSKQFPDKYYAKKEIKREWFKNDPKS